MKIELTIPSASKEGVMRLVKKINRTMPDVSVKFGRPYDKAYMHSNADRNGDLEVLMHNVCDMTLTMPDAGKWIVKAKYIKGGLHVTDMTKPLVIKVAGHGSDYGKCDICGHRTWAKSYLIENTTTGEELQVGGECLKELGISQLAMTHRYCHELYAVLGLQYESDDGGLDGGSRWRFPSDPAAHRSVLVSDCIKVAKRYYDLHGGKWRKGEYINDRYYKSESKVELERMLDDGAGSDAATDEYVAAAINYMHSEIEPHAVPPSFYDNEPFDWKLCQVMGGYYCAASDCAMAFFLVKRYEQSLLAKRFESVANGQYVYVNGVVLSHSVEYGIYGSYDVYEFKTSTGRLVRRRGKVKTATDGDGVERAEFYAQVERAYATGDVVVGRASYKPKKGIEYVAL